MADLTINNIPGISPVTPAPDATATHGDTARLVEGANYRAVVKGFTDGDAVLVINKREFQAAPNASFKAGEEALVKLIGRDADGKYVFKLLEPGEKEKTAAGARSGSKILKDLGVRAELPYIKETLESFVKFGLKLDARSLESSAQATARFLAADANAGNAAPSKADMQAVADAVALLKNSNITVNREALDLSMAVMSKFDKFDGNFSKLFAFSSLKLSSELLKIMPELEARDKKAADAAKKIIALIGGDSGSGEKLTLVKLAGSFLKEGPDGQAARILADAAGKAMKAASDAGTSGNLDESAIGGAIDLLNDRGIPVSPETLALGLATAPERNERAEDPSKLLEASKRELESELSRILPELQVRDKKAAEEVKKMIADAADSPAKPDKTSIETNRKNAADGAEPALKIDAKKVADAVALLKNSDITVSRETLVLSLAIISKSEKPGEKATKPLKLPPAELSSELLKLLPELEARGHEAAEEVKKIITNAAESAPEPDKTNIEAKSEEAFSEDAAKSEAVEKKTPADAERTFKLDAKKVADAVALLKNSNIAVSRETLALGLAVVSKLNKSGDDVSKSPELSHPRVASELLKLLPELEARDKKAADAARKIITLLGGDPGAAETAAKIKPEEKAAGKSLEPHAAAPGPDDAGQKNKQGAEQRLKLHAQSIADAISLLKNSNISVNRETLVLSLTLITGQDGASEKVSESLQTSDAELSSQLSSELSKLLPELETHHKDAAVEVKKILAGSDDNARTVRTQNAKNEFPTPPAESAERTRAGNDGAKTDALAQLNIKNVSDAINLLKESKTPVNRETLALSLALLSKSEKPGEDVLKLLKMPKAELSAELSKFLPELEMHDKKSADAVKKIIAFSGGEARNIETPEKPKQWALSGENPKTPTDGRTPGMDEKKSAETADPALKLDAKKVSDAVSLLKNSNTAINRETLTLSLAVMARADKSGGDPSRLLEIPPARLSAELSKMLPRLETRDKKTAETVKNIIEILSARGGQAEAPSPAIMKTAAGENREGLAVSMPRDAAESEAASGAEQLLELMSALKETADAPKNGSFAENIRTALEYCNNNLENYASLSLYGAFSNKHFMKLPFSYDGEDQEALLEVEARDGKISGLDVYVTMAKIGPARINFKYSQTGGQTGIYCFVGDAEVREFISKKYDEARMASSNLFGFPHFFSVVVGNKSDFTPGLFKYDRGGDGLNSIDFNA